MDQDIDTIEESFDSIPDEVKHYIYNHSFIESFKNLCTEQNLSAEETDRFRVALYSYLAQIDTEESLLTCISSVTKSIESNQKVIDWVKENVVEKVMSLATDAYINEGEETEDAGQPKTSPSDYSLSAIQEQLSKASTIAPTKRDYSVGRSDNQSTPAQNTPKPVFDIYREPPTK